MDIEYTDGLDNPKGQLGLGGIDEMGGENEVKLRELEVGGVENSKLQVGFGEIKEMKSEGKAHVGVVQNSIMKVDFREIDDIGSETGTEFLPDFGGVEFGGVKFGDVEEMSESCVEEKEENETVEGEKTDGIVGVEVSKAGEQKSSVVWWKAPLDILKCCAFRIRPVWE
uniref:Uncharacterized protein n=1 Tax=Solanum lycopersicum TaxID=4081 RepID=A0A3Q7IVF3_SOLLC